MSWLEQKDALEEYARSLDKSARLKPKKSRLWNIGALKTFATTLGRTVYIPEDWSERSVRSVSPHEILGHVRQFKWFGLGWAPLGIFPGMFIVYLLLPFPILFAWCRYRLELHAETKAWEHKLRNSLMTMKQVREKAERAANAVSGSAYIYAWPKPWARWGYNRRATKVIREYVKNASGS